MSGILSRMVPSISGVMLSGTFLSASISSRRSTASCNLSPGNSLRIVDDQGLSDHTSHRNSHIYEQFRSLMHREDLLYPLSCLKGCKEPRWFRLIPNPALISIYWEHLPHQALWTNQRLDYQIK